MATWLDLIGAGISGGLAVKVIDHGLTELRSRRENSRAARQVVDKHLDPILKSADELVGKLRSLAQSDFKELIGLPAMRGRKIDDLLPLGASCYFFAQFWSHVQIFRMESLYTTLGGNKSGQRLQKFVYSLESTRIRLVERVRQRGIGEAIIDLEKQRPLTFHDFLASFGEDERLQEWLEPLEEHLRKANHKSHRQRLLVYGAVLHAMIDTLDPMHLVTRERPGWSNKLTKRSRRELRYRVFGEYLTFVKDPWKYCG